MNRLFHYFLRNLLPNYDFFSSDSGITRVECRWGFHQPLPDQWHQILAPQRRKFWNLFYNPIGNQRLFEISNFQRLVMEMSVFQNDTKQYTTTEEICAAISLSHIPPREDFNFFQYRLLIGGVSLDSTTTVLYQSPILRNSQHDH